MLRSLLLLLTFLVSSPALAQLTARQNAIQPQLALETRGNPGGEADLAIVMRTTPGWHGYWLNPGDAGLPMRVEWTLPKGWSVGALRYPVPSRLLVAGIENYVYERDYAVLTRLRIPVGETGSMRISAKLDYLACTDKICVPEKAEVSLDVALSGTPAPDKRFDEWRRALPRPLASPASFAIKGRKLEIAVPLPSSVSIGQPYFFPADDGPIDYAAPQNFRRKGDILIAELERRRGSPRSVSGVLALGDGRGLQLLAMPGNVPDGGRAVGSLGAEAVLWAVLGAILGGLLLNLMPCVFPILALKALHLARSGGDEVHARRDALAYTAGAVIGTGLLGALLLAIRAGGSAAGWAFQLQDPRTTLLLMLLATAISLNLLRAFELPVLAGEGQRLGSFGTGALAAFVATPCAGPFLGAALGTALLLPVYGSIAVFAALGFGLAVPFLLVAFVPALRTKLPRPGPWMARLQRFLAIPMIATAVGCLWLLYRQVGWPALLVGSGAAVLLAVLLIAVGRTQRKGGSFGLAAGALSLVLAGGAVLLVPQQPVAASRVPLGASAWSAEAVQAARADGRPAFVYFTADWCLTCKANEAAAIEREATRDAFGKAGVEVFVGDWTNGDPAITRFLEERGRAGVPLYLWYEPGQTEPDELPQVLTPSMLSDLAHRRRR
ncbi:protein-disulfide reductase DsbD family protein [Sphingomonas edaphi]|uniref:Thiol:disulfide interchange protein n=1 Tax=Sphingomonas edaphi TaxID=2315689 RepID=A0A418Q1Z4_9SPHN|nr:protein-disulfide reductase DsbD domain-containing protein [Sphingomonas edaphi]RIX32066.1 thiol:disulfide interchange protein [Sphingomonas edaphi]